MKISVLITAAVLALVVSAPAAAHDRTWARLTIGHGPVYFGVDLDQLLNHDYRTSQRHGARHDRYGTYRRTSRRNHHDRRDAYRHRPTAYRHSPPHRHSGYCHLAYERAHRHWH